MLNHPNTGQYPDQYLFVVRIRGYASLAKDKRVNIRISSRDLDDIQAKAAEEAIPYQTLMSSVLHKYVTGRLVEPQTIPRASGTRQKRRAP